MHCYKPLFPTFNSNAQAAIEASLDTCLLSEEEMAKYEANWAKLPDPPHADAPKEGE